MKEQPRGRFTYFQDREDPEKVLDLLQKQFGEQLTPSQVVSEFHPQKRNKDEMLWDYSHALIELMDQVAKANLTFARDPAAKDKILTDHFMDGVSDHKMHISLLDHVDRQPDVLFKEL